MSWVTSIMVWSALVLGPMVVLPFAARHWAWWMRFPRLGQMSWLAGIGVGMVAGAAGVGWAVGYVATGDDRADGGILPTLFALVAWFGFAVAGVEAAVAWTRAEPLLRERRQAQASAILLAAEARYMTATVGRDEVVFVHDGRAYACCFVSRSVVVSSGLVGVLTDAEVRAVIEHERAHLRGHHAAFVALVQVAGACCPAPGAGRALARSARLLVELAADDAAARKCGAAVVCNALTRLGDATGDSGMLVRAQRIASRPVRRRSTADRGRLPSLAIASGLGALRGVEGA